MSTKKRFSISPDLASGLRSTIQSASSNQGQLHYDMMAIEAIEPDPENPRELAISTEELLNGLNQNDPNYSRKVKELEALNELAESIKRIGIRNAIEVYKEGSKYRIVSGERRFLAAILTGQKSVPVRINQKPDEFNLRYTQWVENINREDLSLWEKFNNLISISGAYKKNNNCDFNEKILQELLGVSATQAYRYLCLMKADEKIIELIESGKLNNLKIIQELVSMKDKGARNQIISWISSSKEEITSLKNYRSVAGKKSRLSTSPNRESINLGKINNSKIAKELIKIVLLDSRFDKYRQGFESVDWSSSISIGKAFKALLTAIEKELCVKETA